MNDDPERDAGRAGDRAGPAVPAGEAAEGAPRSGGPAPRFSPADGQPLPASRTPGMLANPWVGQWAGTSGDAGAARVQPPPDARPPGAAQQAGGLIDAGQAPPGARPPQARDSSS